MCSRKQAVGWEARRKIQSRFGGRKNDWKWTEPVEAGLGPPRSFWCRLLSLERCRSNELVVLWHNLSSKDLGRINGWMQ